MLINYNLSKMSEGIFERSREDLLKNGLRVPERSRGVIRLPRFSARRQTGNLQNRKLLLINN